MTPSRLAITRASRLQTPAHRPEGTLAVFGTILVILVTLNLTVAGPPWAVLLGAAPDVAVTWLAIAVSSGAMILRASTRYPFSIDMVHWIFVHVFLWIAPIIQQESGAFPWGGLDANDFDSMFSVNLLVLAWCTTWWATYSYHQGRSRNRASSARLTNKSSFSRIQFIDLAILLVIGSAVTLLAILASGGWPSLFFRAVGDEVRGDLSLANVALFAGRILPALLLVLLIRARSSGNSISPSTLLLAAIGTLLLAFPTAVPRFWFATVIIGILGNTPILTKRGIFPVSLLFSLVVIFPVLGGTRRATNFDETAVINAGSNIFDSGDFDAYSMLGAIKDYVDSQGSTDGRQLLTALLFFVRRSFWPGKSVGTGSYVSSKIGLSYDNVSAPLPAEGFVNFGWVGVLLFAISAAAIASSLDLRFWMPSIGRLSLAYPFFVGGTLFILRGDLLSSIAFMTMMFLPAALLSLVFYRRYQLALTKVASQRVGPKPSDVGRKSSDVTSAGRVLTVRYRGTPPLPRLRRRSATRGFW